MFQVKPEAECRGKPFSWRIPFFFRYYLASTSDHLFSLGFDCVMSLLWWIFSCVCGQSFKDRMHLWLTLPIVPWHIALSLCLLCVIGSWPGVHGGYHLWLWQCKWDVSKVETGKCGLLMDQGFVSHSDQDTSKNIVTFIWLCFSEWPFAFSSWWDQDNVLQHPASWTTYYPGDIFHKF